ncbi:MAG: response regulator [Chloroflexi bacterium]|nr:response regulator [Chloroflexota bacterium]
MAKILIIDDDAETIRLLETITRLEGHETLSVLESRNALQAAESFRPDLVLLDIMMPEINGIAICKLIKSKPEISSAKVMMVSALSDEGTRRDAANAGATQFVTKPIIPKALTKQIDELLNR